MKTSKRKMSKAPSSKYVPFRERFDAKDRENESRRIRSKYPERVPVIAEPAKNCSLALAEGEELKTKFLVPNSLTIGQFIYIIRKRQKLTPEQAIFLFVNGRTIPAHTALMSQIYEEHGSPDGFLYMEYSGESTFG